MADWTGFALTGLGGVLAAGGGFLNGWAQSRRERNKDDLGARRLAYVEFLYQGESLHVFLQECAAYLRRQTLPPDRKEFPELTQDRMSEIDLRHREFERASAGVTVSGSEAVREVSDRVTGALAHLWILFHRYYQQPTYRPWTEWYKEIVDASQKVIEENKKLVQEINQDMRK